jgi:anaerobic ribonucleoside-triphosphate reductase
MRSGQICPETILNITNVVYNVFQNAIHYNNTEEADKIQELFQCKGMRYDDFMFFFADIFVESV